MTNLYSYIYIHIYWKTKILKILVHMFHKTRRLNHQPVKFKIKSTLLNIDAKVIQKNKKEYDVILCITKIQYKNRSTI